MDTTKLYFTRKGADKLMAFKQALIERLRAVQGRKGETLSQGETWHDNAEFEELVRQESMINAQIAETLGIIGRILVVDTAPPNTDRLRIGHVATLLVNSETKRVLVGGYEDSDLDSDPQILSYLAPLIRPFIGKEVSHEATVTINNQPTRVSLEDISLPSSKDG